MCVLCAVLDNQWWCLLLSSSEFGHQPIRSRVTSVVCGVTTILLCYAQCTLCLVFLWGILDITKIRQAVHLSMHTHTSTHVYHTHQALDCDDVSSVVSNHHLDLGGITR